MCKVKYVKGDCGCRIFGKDPVYCQKLKGTLKRQTVNAMKTTFAISLTRPGENKNYCLPDHYSIAQENFPETNMWYSGLQPDQIVDEIDSPAKDRSCLRIVAERNSFRKVVCPSHEVEDDDENEEDEEEAEDEEGEDEVEEREDLEAKAAKVWRETWVKERMYRVVWMMITRPATEGKS